MGEGFLGLQFKDNVTEAEAKDFERLFNRIVSSVSCTEFL
jgi:hypothetical protein